MSMQRTVLLLDDDPSVLRSMQVLAVRSGWEPLAAQGIREARAQLAYPGVIVDAAVVDLQLSDGWGLDLVPTLMGPPQLCGGIVVATGLCPDPQLAAGAYARGAASVLWKPFGITLFREALEAAVRRTDDLRRVAQATGQPVGSPSVGESAEERLLGKAAHTFLLGDLEVEIVRGLCAERTDRELAAALEISESSLKRTQATIRAKMGVETRAGIVRRVYESGLSIRPGPSSFPS